MKFIRQMAIAAVIAAATLVPASAADAAKRAPAPKPTPTPTPTIAPAPTSVNWYLIRPDLAEGLSRPATQYVEHQVIAGPGITTPGPIVRGLSGGLYVRGLQAGSTYSVRVRNIAVGASPSAWTTFSLTTTTQFAERPPAPQNLRETARTATTVTVAWDAPDAAFYSYEAFAGSTPLLLDFAYAIELRERTFARPPVGTSVSVSVAARDVNQNLSLPATLQVTG